MSIYLDIRYADDHAYSSKRKTDTFNAAIQVLLVLLLHGGAML